MSAGTGVSFEPLGDNKWRIRWRERRPDGRWRRLERWFAGSPHDRDALILDIRRALDEEGTWNPKAGLARVMPPPAADLFAGIEACIAARLASGRYSESTAQTYRSVQTRIERAIREVLRRPRGVVQVDVLNRDLFERMIAAEAIAGRAQGAKYQTALFLLNAWKWLATADPEQWPGVPRPPHDARDFLPASPVWRRTVAPSLGHVDAVLRVMCSRSTAQRTRHAALFMRYLGLRIGEATALRGTDLDLAREWGSGRGICHVPGTKSEASDRIIPLPRALLAEAGVREAIEAAGERRLFPLSTGVTATFTKAWKVAPGVPREVWAPRNRKKARPTHAFRAFLQAYLREQRTPEDVIDAIVGHDGDMRSRHYGRELQDGMRRALDGVPAVEWGTSGGVRARPGRTLQAGLRATSGGLRRRRPVPHDVWATIEAEYGPFDVRWPDAGADNGSELPTREAVRECEACRVWALPTYRSSRTVRAWLRRALAAIDAGAVVVVMMLPDRPDTDWYRAAFAAGAEMRRVKRYAGEVRGESVASLLLVFRGAP